MYIQTCIILKGEKRSPILFQRGGWAPWVLPGDLSVIPEPAPGSGSAVTFSVDPSLFSLLVALQTESSLPLLSC